ncbi:MAG: hypothetical protein ACXWVA_04405 [Rhodoplanes sp.]
MRQMTGLDEFKRVLSEYKNLSLWAGGASVIFPFIASFLSVIPPWPAGLNIITSVMQLGALVVSYQTFRNTARSVSRNVKLWAALGFMVVLIYMVAFTMLTVYVPYAQRSIVIGFQCLPDAQHVFDQSQYIAKCPFLGVEELSAVAFNEFQLLTKFSIAIARMLLIALWFAIFICLAFLIGQFLVYQMRRRVAD